MLSVLPKPSLSNYLKLFSGSVLLLFLGAALRRNWVYDELECLQSAWFVAQGSVVYKDFFQHHHPLMYYILSPFAYLLEPEAYLYVARLITWSCLVSTTFVIMALGDLIFLRPTGFITAGIFLSINTVAVSGFEIRPDALQLVLAVTGTYYFFRFLIYKEQSALYMSGLLYSFSFLAIQKSFPFLFFGFIALMCQWYHKKIVFRDVFLWSGTVSLPILLYWSILWFKGHWDIYWVCNYLFNAKLAAKFTFGDFIKTFLTEIFLPQLWIWFFFLIGFLLSKDAYFKLLISIIALSLCIMKINGEHYWIVIFPFISILAAYGMQFFFNNKQKYLCLFLSMMMLPNVRHLLGNIHYGNQEELLMLKNMRNLQPKNGTCYGGLMVCNFRKNADYFWYGAFDKTRNIFKNFFPELVMPFLNIFKRHPNIIQKSKIKENQSIKIFLQNNYRKTSILSDVYCLKYKSEE